MKSLLTFFSILLASALLACADDVTPPAGKSPTALPSTNPSFTVDGGSYEYRRSTGTGGISTPPSQLRDTGQPQAATAIPASAENSPNDSGGLSSQLAQGIMSEEAEGNLPGAMSQYEKLISQFDQSRAAAANALFRLAEGHRKLGQNEEAKIAYSRVLREFPDLEQLASLSHKGFVACKAQTAINTGLPPREATKPPEKTPTTDTPDQSASQANSAPEPLPPIPALVTIRPNTLFPDIGTDQYSADVRQRVFLDYFKALPASEQSVLIRKWPQVGQDKVNAVIELIHSVRPFTISVVECTEDFDNEIRGRQQSAIEAQRKVAYQDTLIEQLQATQPRYLPQDKVTPLYAKLKQNYEAAVIAATSAEGKQNLAFASEQLETYKHSVVLADQLHERSVLLRNLNDAIDRLKKTLAAEAEAQKEGPTNERGSRRTTENARPRPPMAEPGLPSAPPLLPVPMVITLHPDSKKVMLGTNQYDSAAFLRILIDRSHERPDSTLSAYIRKWPQTPAADVEALAATIRTARSAYVSVGDATDRFGKEITAAQQAVIDARKSLAEQDKLLEQFRHVDPRFLPSRFATAPYGKLQKDYADAMAKADQSVEGKKNLETAMAAIREHREKVVLPEQNRQRDLLAEELKKAEDKLLQTLALEQSATSNPK